MSRDRPPALTSPARVFVDSSAFFAVLSVRDRGHHQALAILRGLRTSRAELVLTNFIRAEAHALLLNRLGHTVATRFLQELATSPANTLIRVSDADEQRALALITTYQDKDFSLTDATSFVVMERLGIAHAFTFDRDFAQYGFTILSA